MARQTLTSSRSPYPLSYGAFNSSPTEETFWWAFPERSTDIAIHGVDHELYMYTDVPRLPLPSKNHRQDPRDSKDIDVQIIHLEGPLSSGRPISTLRSASQTAPGASVEPPSISRCPSLTSASSITSRPSIASLSSHSTSRQRPTLRHKYSPPGRSLRELRCMESEVCLKRVYEAQLNAYLDGTIFTCFGRSEMNR